MSTAPPHSTQGSKVPTGKPPDPHLAGRQSSVGTTITIHVPLEVCQMPGIRCSGVRPVSFQCLLLRPLRKGEGWLSPPYHHSHAVKAPVQDCPVGQDATPSPLVIQEHKGQDPGSAHGCPTSHPFPKGAGNPTSAGSSQSRGPKMYQPWTRHPPGPFPWVLPLLKGRVLFRKGLRSWGSREVARSWHVGQW